MTDNARPVAIYERGTDRLIGIYPTQAAIPPLPSRLDLTSELNALNEAFAHPDCGPEYVSLYCEGAGWPDAHWTVGCEPYDWPQAGCEWVRGDGKFDAYMAASRLLTAAKKAGYK